MIEVKLDSEDAKRWRRWFLGALGLALACWLAYLVREIWLPLVIAFLIAMVLDPIVDRMERRGWSRLKGAIIIYLAFFVTFGTLLTLAIPAVVSQATQVTKAIGQYLPSEDTAQTTHSLKRLLNHFHAPPLIRTQVLHASAQISRAAGNTGDWIARAAQALVSNILWLVIIPIVSFYALKDFHVIFARLLMLVPSENRETTETVINKISAIFVHYLRGLLIVCTLNGVVTALVLMLYHLPNALALGFFSGVMYSVPYLGALLTIAVTAGIALMSFNIQHTLLVVVTLIVLHSVIFDQIVTPRIVGQQVGLHPILAIVALLAGGSLLGIFGMILAVPLAATLQMILITLFPKMGQPIDVPEGEVLHEEAAKIAQSNSTVDEIQDEVDVHETIVRAVETSEAQAADAPAQAAANPS